MNKKIVKDGSSKIATNPQHFKKWLEKEDIGPLVIEVGVTYGCNHNCVHCSFQQFDSYTGVNFINKDAFIQFLDEFKLMGGIEVYFAGNGEPLLHPHICEFFEYGKKIGLDMTLSTNGEYLTDEIANRILQATKWVNFSINGGNLQDYITIHKCSEESFYKVIKNIKNVMKVKQESNLDIKVVMQYIAYSLNKNGIDDIVKLYHELGVDQLNIRSAGFRSEYNTFEDKKILDKLNELNNIEGIIVRWDSNMAVAPWDKCYGINFRINMDYQGNIYPCSKNYYENCTIGSIEKKSFKEIWLSEKKKQVFFSVENTKDTTKCRTWCQCRGDNIYIDNYLKEQII